MEVQRLDRQNHQMNEEIKELKKDNQQFKYYFDLIKVDKQQILTDATKLYKICIPSLQMAF